MNRFVFMTVVRLLSALREPPQEGNSDTDSLSSSVGRKQLHNPCVLASDTPYRKISRDELLMFGQSTELPASVPTAAAHTTSSSNSSSSSGSLRDSTPPPLPPTPATSPSPALEHHQFVHRGSPDLTRVIPEPQSMTAPPGKSMYNGVLEKSYSFSQVPASMLPNAGRYPSLTSLDSELRSVGREHKLQSTSSQDSSDNGEKTKRSSSKIKNLFKKRK